MNKKILSSILIVFFLALSIGAILNFTTLENAKWADNGLDIIVGIVLICFGSTLYFAYKETNNKNILWVSLGVFIIAFQKIIEIFLQEWQISINYQYPLVLGLDSSMLSWGIADLTTMVGIIFIFLGLRRILK